MQPAIIFVSPLGQVETHHVPHELFAAAWQYVRDRHANPSQYSDPTAKKEYWASIPPTEVVEEHHETKVIPAPDAKRSIFDRAAQSARDSAPKPVPEPVPTPNKQKAGDSAFFASLSALMAQG